MAKKSGTARAGRKQLTPAEKEARKEALKNESKEAKFVRLALPRVNKALNAIRQIGSLSGPGYLYTSEQIEKMDKVLSEACDDAIERFNKTGSKEKQAFAFS